MRLIKLFCGGEGARVRRLNIDILVAAALMSLWLLSASASGAEATENLEQRVKAAFLYQFAAYVEWPPYSFVQADSPVTIAVMGAEPLAAELSQVVAGRTVGGRALAVKRVRPGESLAGVHILFVGKAENSQLSQLAQGAKPRPILTVTESDGALAQGSMINFVLVDRRVRFEIALDSAEKSGLKLSSRLLAVAQDVRVGGGR